MHRPAFNCSDALGNIAAALIVGCVAGAQAQEETEFSPATFPDDERSLARKLQFPDIETDVDLRVLCDSAIDTWGRFRYTVCFTEADSPKVFERAIFSGAEEARMIPAQVGGRRVNVWFQFSVVFRKDGGRKTMDVFPHHFLDVQQYGLDYIGPQRYDFTGHWRFCPMGNKVWIAMTVDEQGVPHDLSVLGEDDPGFCADYLKRMAGTGLYIPAFSEGRPVKARAIEMFFNANVARFR